MQDTTINWTEKTWNPMSGCEVVSEGCKHCYAKTLAERYGGTAAFPNGFGLTLRPHKLTEPYRIKEPSIIFVNSMSDLFWDKVTNDYRDKIVDVIEATSQHIYQVLTKRPDIMLEYSRRRPLPANFWAGTTIESERTMPRLDLLRQVKATTKFISAEPLLSPLSSRAFGYLDLAGVDWVITGGESGLHLNEANTLARRGLVMKLYGKWMPRPDRIGWIRQIRDACLSQNIEFWHKQWGGPRPESAGRLLDGQEYNGRPTITTINQPTLL